MAKQIKAGSALDWILGEITPKQKQPDEFTVEDVAEAIEREMGKRPSISGVRNKLWERVNNGELEKRYIIQNGSRTTAYRKKG